MIRSICTARRADLRGIVAFEIEVTEIQAAFKLSQNRNEKDWQNIIQELETIGTENAHNVAKAMKENPPVR